MSVIAGLLRPYLLQILLGAAVVAAVMGVFLYGRSSGRMVERVEGMRHQLKNVENRNDVTRETDRLPDDAVTERLHDRWSRD